MTKPGGASIRTAKSEHQAEAAGPVDLSALPVAALYLDSDGSLRSQNALAEALAAIVEGADTDPLGLNGVPGFAAWLTGGGPETFSCRLQVSRANGVPVTVDVNARRSPGGGALCLVQELDREQVAFEAQRYFDVAFDAAPIGMALFNTDGEYVRVNAALCRFLGRSEHELIGRRDQEFTHPEDRQADVDAAWRILRGEISSWQCEKRFVRPDGSVVWAIANLTFLRDAAGNPMSWVGQFQDVTKRKQAEALLQRERRQLAEAQALARLGSWEWDVRSDRVEWSDGMAAIYGRQVPADLTLESVLELTHPADRDRLREVVQNAYESGVPFELEYRIVRPDGTERVVYARGDKASGEGAVAQRMVGTVQDITRLKEAYLALEASERQTRQILESAQDPYVAMDFEGRVVDWNPAAEAAFGWSRSEILGRNFVSSMLRREDHPAGRRIVEGLRSAESGSVLGRRLELPVLRRDGGEVPVELTISLADGPMGRTVSAFLRDRTPQLRAEAAIAEARDAAIEASRLKSNFLANMSHEIRTPMNAVIGMTDLLLDTALDPAQREYASTVRTASRALLEIINDILDFSKIEAGKLRLEPTDLSIPALVDEVARILSGAADEKGLRLSTAVDPGCPERVVGDAGRLRQVLLNLLGNAVKFTNRGQVGLRAGPEPDGRVRFEITDTGIGIPKEAQAQLFQAFHQVDSSLTRSHGGTGLGLVISKQLVGLMGGEIGVESEPGAGSRFWFTVPFEEARPSVRPLPSEELAERGSGELVLVAEDNVVNQLVAVSMLAKLGYEAEVVPGGAEAVAAVAAGRYAAVLMDCQMPGMDGFDATREIRRGEPGTGHVPVIAMTAGAMHGDRERCLAAGMDDYVSKPVRTEELGRVLRRWVGAPVRNAG